MATMAQNAESGSKMLKGNDLIRKNRAKRSASARSSTPELMHNIEIMMSQISELSTIYHTETEALKKADTDMFRALQYEKQMQVNAYEKTLGSLLKRKEELKTLDDRTRERLREMQKEFSALAEKNVAVLSRVQGATKRINQMVLKATRRAYHNDLAVSYGRNGKLDVEDRRNLTTGRVQSEA